MSTSGAPAEDVRTANKQRRAEIRDLHAALSRAQADLEAAREVVERALAARDEAILAAREAGVPVSHIQGVTGLSRPAVYKITDKAATAGSAGDA
ncbi:hypothetical protein [Lolliginicoccus levis]|uniref:hypothetical protein n=1 Tax=Lolliginicoccus levis TaxID=2919542 RepID=UPI00241E37EA|nr:hypothetical protein [Lolliginicoccus levis]